MKNKLKVGIIGASGYAGAELLRLLLQHPAVEVVAIGAGKEVGNDIADLYPGFYQKTNLTLTDTESVLAAAELIFISLPHGYAEEIVKACLKDGKRCIDLGADFRLEEEEQYQKWYGLSYREPQLHQEAVYGLPEFHREQIRKAKVIGNPGCYPTSITLGLFPALAAGILDVNSIIIDSKSGVTGAGKELTAGTHFPRTNEAFAPYKIGAHRHIPEIEQVLTEMSGEPTTVTFVPHLLPISRGIISTIYAKLKQPMTATDIRKLYEAKYGQEEFVRLLPEGRIADLKFVKYSNFCDISLHSEERTGRLIIVSCIDNMVKGAAGQAIQNMNILIGEAENCGLTMIPPSF